MSKLIAVLDGLDGCGKSTQLKLVSNKLKDMGYMVDTIKFPSYQNKSSMFVKNYLNGDYGENVSPYVSAMFYALDRYGSYYNKDKLQHSWKSIIENPNIDIILMDRYVCSNIIYNVAKIINNTENDIDLDITNIDIYNYIINMEYNYLNLPKPDMEIYLHIPIEVTIENIKNRGEEQDINEKNHGYLKKCYYVSNKYYSTNDNICQKYIIDVTDSNNVMYDMFTIRDNIIDTIISHDDRIIL